MILVSNGVFFLFFYVTFFFFLVLSDVKFSDQKTGAGVVVMKSVNTTSKLNFSLVNIVCILETEHLSILVDVSLTNENYLLNSIGILDSLHETPIGKAETIKKKRRYTRT
jgi:hypothetical protein